MLPPTVRTATVHLGPFVDDVGAPWSGRVTLTSNVPRVWAATGAVVEPRPVVVELDDDGAAELTLAVTDQPGFTDLDGRLLPGWTYVVVVELDGQPPVRHVFGLPAGGSSEPSVRLDRRGLTRRDALRAGVVAVTAAAAVAGGALPAAAGPRRSLLPAAQVIDDDVTIGSTANPSTLTLKSSAAGGTTGGSGYYDSTGRIVLETYQPHFRSYGESIRVQLKDARAKGMLTYQGSWTRPHYPDGDYTWLSSHPQQPVTIAWIGAHFLNNDDPSSLEKNKWHGHINFEVPDAKGALRTRLEIKLIDPVTGKIGTDRSAIRTNMADFEHQVGAAGEQLRIVGSDARDKDLAWCTEVGANQPRWVLRATREDSDLEFRRYQPGRDYRDAPLKLWRDTGLVEVGGERGTGAGLSVVQDGGVGITVRPQAVGGQGILVAGRPGDTTARVIQGDVTGDSRRRFVVQVDGTVLWGPGGNGPQDTLLYRRAPNQLGTDGGLFLRSSSAPAVATTGGVVFVEGGALKYRGSAGTVTTLAPA